MENDLKAWFERVRVGCQYYTPDDGCIYGKFKTCRADGCEFVQLLKKQDNGTNREGNNGNTRRG